MTLERYNTQYKTFDSLMVDIEDDLSSLSAERYIFPDKYYKVIETCNSKLSTKINPVKEDIITISKGRGKLPSDFKLLNNSFFCLSFVELNYEAVNVNKDYSDVNVKYSYKDVRTGCTVLSSIEDTKGMNSFVVFKRNTQSWYNIKKLIPVSVVNSSALCTHSCMQGYSSYNAIKITKEDSDYYIESPLEGELYITYVSEMIDDEGNLIMLDHPTVREYYEYSIKERIYEELWLNGIEEYQTKLSYITEKLRLAKIEAIKFVRMYDFAELKQVYFDNRKLFKLRYDKIIKE